MEECISVFDMLKLVLAHLVLIPLDLGVQENAFLKKLRTKICFNLLQSENLVIWLPILNRNGTCH
jgi:hypothetical protein